MPEHRTKYTFQNFGKLLSEIKQAKPNDQSLLDRRYDVLIKNLQREYEYYRKHILVLPEDE